MKLKNFCVFCVLCFCVFVFLYFVVLFVYSIVTIQRIPLMLEAVTTQSPHVASAASRSFLTAASDRPSSLHFLLWSLTVCLAPSRSQETGAILRMSNARRTPWRAAAGTAVAISSATSVRGRWTMEMTHS